MRQLQPVIWAKGTFLTPNHLQVQDRYWDSLVNFRVDALSFCPWGFLTLEIDRQALAGGYFAILKASGLFPDGLAFDIPSADPAPAPKPLQDYLKQGSVDLYLALPPYRVGGRNVTGKAQNADSRFVADELDLRDENNGRIERKIQIARKNFRLLAEHEVREGTPALHAARLHPGPGGLPEFDADFIPHLLDIGSSERVLSITKTVLETLTARSNELSLARSERRYGVAQFSSGDIANFWLLYTVNSYLPLVRHILETRRGHPELLFSTLLALAGALTAYSSDIRPSDFLAYNHDRLEECFGDLASKLEVLLRAPVPRNFVSLPLTQLKPYIYSCSLDDERYLKGKMYLAVAAENPEADLITRVPYLLKVGSVTQIDQLIRSALSAVGLRHVPDPPQTVPMKVSYQYFSLNQAGEAWDSIERARNVAVFTGDLRNPQMELIILLPEA